ncbi:unnamed protein product [Schistosoma curassoni]|uniref:DctM domain-containing protein n=1 Tax=Schistosoma curassoni TaxID=6186 RepID=A0A183L5M1_9TREM|nr:unnamed protein product [Schistosoma curassoni]
MFAVTSISDFSASAGILSGPAAFQLLVYLMVMLIPPVGGLTSIGMSVYAAPMSSGFNGVGLFKSSSKYSTYLFLCS